MCKFHSFITVYTCISITFSNAQQRQTTDYRLTMDGWNEACALCMCQTQCTARTLYITYTLNAWLDSEKRKPYIWTSIQIIYEYICILGIHRRNVGFALKLQLTLVDPTNVLPPFPFKKRHSTRTCFWLSVFWQTSRGGKLSDKNPIQFMSADESWFSFLWRTKDILFGKFSIHFSGQ